MLLKLINFLHTIKLEFLHQISQSKVKAKTSRSIRKTSGFEFSFGKKFTMTISGSRSYLTFTAGFISKDVL